MHFWNVSDIGTLNIMDCGIHLSLYGKTANEKISMSKDKGSPEPALMASFNIEKTI